MISSINIRFFEEYNYHIVEKYIQKNINKYINNNQFGFKKKHQLSKQLKI